MQEVSYFEAWVAWWQGPTQDLTLWGHSILFWGRIGKIVQFVAALAIIVEILGPERLRKAGASLKAMSPFSKTSRDKSVFDGLNPLNIVGIKTGIYLGFRLALGFHVGMWLIAKMGDVNFVLLGVILIVCTVLGFLAGIFGVMLVYGLAVLAGGLLAFCVAWPLEHPSVDKFVKVLSVLLLIAGFHFDLLAS